MRQFGDELEADLLEFFGVDLLDLWRGRLSLRRVHVLVQSLVRKPGRSTLVAAMDESASWSPTDFLMARVSDALELSNFLFLKAHSSEAAEIEPPVPIPRPGDPEPVGRAEYEFASGEELSGFFSQLGSL
ncbi:hypothetical protein AB852_00670 [Streptomyces uncialis]|uniref:Uncharacterized protein n=1 Tax=Streptomyces uncialis TaxID=1048205 RepID=A0A1Q4VC35_9ACTN|nr:hypothetical protein AB852_00670 [Streptomyces uncialis]